MDDSVLQVFSGCTDSDADETIVFQGEVGLMEKRINVTRSSMPELDEYIEELRPVWESRWLSNRGAASIKFENMLRSYLDVEEVYCFANGHVALEVAINSLFFPAGSEVITTPYTHCSTTHAIVRNGLKPVFVDVEPHTLTIDPDLVEQAITEKTVAILATHVYGFPCQVERLQRIADEHHLTLIYDAAHAFGVRVNGVGIGNYGDLSMFSTHATKVFHTIEGGIVTYKSCDLERFDPMNKLVNFGFSSPEDIDYVGTNARMNEFEAVMGIVNLHHIDEEIAKRKKVAEQYWKRLEGVRGIILLRPSSEVKWNYAYFPVLFDGYALDRNQIQQLLSTHQIYARKYFFPITNEAKCYVDTYGDVCVPVARSAAQKVLTLPMYADLSRDDVDRICDVILSVRKE